MIILFAFFGTWATVLGWTLLAFSAGKRADRFASGPALAFDSHHVLAAVTRSETGEQPIDAFALLAAD